MNLRRSVIAFLGLWLALGTAVTGSLQAQQAAQQTSRGSITGIVKDAQSGLALGQANVVIPGTAQGATTGTDGRYTIANVPAGIVTLSARRVGYSPTTRADVRVRAGAPTTVDISLSASALVLTSVVTTGMSDPATGLRAPFSVAVVGPEKLEIASMNNPLEVLAGKVASLSIRGGNSPGSDVVIQIRNPLSITGFTQPMIIVDGVIQMQDDPTIGARSITGNPLDLNGDNIESIEVVRGAAAAALYGQKAANGVINITTKRGSDMALNTTRMTLTNEGGVSSITKYLPQVQHHRFLVDDNNQFIDASGRLITDWRETAGDTFSNDPNLYMDNIWGVPIYDNERALFTTGVSFRNSLLLSQNSLATNFSISGSALHESGIMREGGGTSRQNVGINLDYRAGAKLQTGLGLQYSKSYLASLSFNPDGTGGNANPFLNAQNICKCVSIRDIDPATGTYVAFPWGDNNEGSLANPLFIESHRDEWDRRIGAQVSANAVFRPTAIFSLRVDGGYNRSDREEQNALLFAGDIEEDADTSAGVYDVAVSLDETYNGIARLSALTGFGGWTFRAGVSTGGEMQRRRSLDVDGDTLTRNQTDFDLIRRVQASSNIRDVRSIDYSANIAFDYNQKYTGEVVFRADGSSLLPPDTRWRSNGRASFAWIMSEEPWWPLPNLTLFKPRYSIGTAGNNPVFSARYELYNQQEPDDNTGTVRVSKANLGNDAIRPEKVTEQEFGLDIALHNRYSVQLNYVRNTVEGNIRPDTILAYTGFDTQQANLGDLRGESYEATFETQWMQTRNLRWSSTLTLSRNRQKIVRYPRLCDTSPGQTNTANSTYQRYCEGYEFGAIYGRYHVTDTSELSPRHRESGTALTHFQRNDEGLLVAVGPNSNWTDMRFGQALTIDGINYSWGLPIYGSRFNDDGTILGPHSKKIGNGLADFDFGFGNQVTAGRFSVFVQSRGQVGGKIFNQARVRAMNREVHASLDQGGKPDYLKKTIAYYTNGETCCGVNGNYGGLTSNEVLPYPRFLESGTFLKVSEMRVSYRLDQGLPILRGLGMTSGSIALIGRDLLTLTNYSGYDPEVSDPSNTTARVDRSTSPNYRNFTAQVRLIF